MIFVNFKTYREGTGENALQLVKTLEDVATERQMKIIPVLQTSDIKEVSSATTLEVWAQNIDSAELGAHTGAITAEAVFEDGAVGTFLNHSENRFTSFDLLSLAVKRAKEVGLKTLVFAKDMDELEKNSVLDPTYLCYEPPELVGSRETSVSESQPEIIAKAVVIAREKGIPLVVGAGIKSAADVRKSVELGAVGVAVASDIVTSENPKEELLDLVGGFN